MNIEANAPNACQSGSNCGTSSRPQTLGLRNHPGARQPLHQRSVAEQGYSHWNHKDEFERNLSEAIETGKLTFEDVRSWLTSIEGWGNQHVYLYSLSSTVRKDLTEPKIRQRVAAAKLDPILRLVWQECSPGWVPVPEKNYTKEEGLDLYEYRAFRRVERRAITRFEAHVKDGIAGLFIADPIQGVDHKAAVEEAKRIISLLMDRQALEQWTYEHCADFPKSRPKKCSNQRYSRAFGKKHNGLALHLAART